MSNLYKKLERLAKQRGISVYKACQDMGIPITFYSDMKSGRTKSYTVEKAKIIADYFNVSVDYLVSDNLEIPATKVPVYGVVPAGVPLEAIENIIDYEEIPPEMASKGKYIALKIKGDSMMPSIIDGDIAIIRLQEVADTGDIVIAMINGEDSTCKKLKKDLKGIWLMPLNPAYEPMYFTNDEVAELPVKILGVVVETRRTFKKL